MPRTDEPNRRYTVEETALILRRAARLQEDVSTEPEGFTLSEIEQIASEAGITPSQVARAAARVGERSGSSYGAVSRFHLRQLVPRVVPPEGWSAIRDEISLLLRKPGRISRYDDGLEWVDEASDREWVRVEVRNLEGAARVEVSADRHDEAAGLLTIAGILGASAAALGVGVLGLEPGTTFWAFIGSGTGGGLAAGWARWRQLSAGWEHRLNTLAARLSAAVEECGRSAEHIGDGPGTPGR